MLNNQQVSNGPLSTASSVSSNRPLGGSRSLVFRGETSVQHSPPGPPALQALEGFSVFWQAEGFQKQVFVCPACVLPLSSPLRNSIKTNGEPSQVQGPISCFVRRRKSISCKFQVRFSVSLQLRHKLHGTQTPKQWPSGEMTWGSSGPACTPRLCLGKFNNLSLSFAHKVF